MLKISTADTLSSSINSWGITLTASIKQLFTEHPAEVGETYFEHLGTASGFSLRLLMASLACFTHALFPFLCVKTGSKMITDLHDGMVSNRVKPCSEEPSPVK